LLNASESSLRFRSLAMIW